MPVGHPMCNSQGYIHRVSLRNISYTLLVRCRNEATENPPQKKHTTPECRPVGRSAEHVDELWLVLAKQFDRFVMQHNAKPRVSTLANFTAITMNGHRKLCYFDTEHLRTFAKHITLCVLLGVASVASFRNDIQITVCQTIVHSSANILKCLSTTVALRQSNLPLQAP